MPATEDVSRTISPNDEMYRGDERHYFDTGKEAIEEIQHAIDFEPTTILDLPCGHGRVMRWLRAEYPEAHITACDLNRDGVDFCAEAFQATPVYSSADLRQVELGTYDLIWCGSLFTHLDAPRWGEFLSFFREHLHGVLVFTTNGPYTRDLLAAAYQANPKAGDARRGWHYFRQFWVPAQGMLDSYEATGFGYVDYRGTPNYGQSIASREWVCNRLGEYDLLSYRERKWDAIQDVVAVT